MIQKVENLGNDDHELQLVRTWSARCLLHDLKQNWHEMVSQLNLRRSLPVNGVLRGSCEFLKSSQTNKLNVLILKFQPLLNLRDSLRPFLGGEIMLSDIINHMLNLRPKKKKWRKIRFKF